MKNYYWNKEQINAMKAIQQILWDMLLSNNEDEVFDLFCQADDLWNEYFPWEASQKGDSWKGVRWYNDKMRSLKKMTTDNTTTNISGNVTINVVFGDFIQG